MLSQNRYLLAITLIIALASPPASRASDTYGPVNLLKSMPTPFGPPVSKDNRHSKNPPVTEPISISSQYTSPLRRKLARRLLSESRLYLPGRLIMGKPADFIVQGKPGARVALATADRDSGAKPIYGHCLRLGPDRKVVAVGVIPATGVLPLSIEAPIDGGLLGLPLFFEAAVWSATDFSDLEIALPIRSENNPDLAQANFKNGVVMSQGSELKKNRLVVPEASIHGLPTTETTAGPHLESGRP